MIPDHALSKAIRAYDANTGFPAVFPLALEAALEAVAADIWDEGLEAARATSCGDIYSPDPNPYRNETA